MGRIGVQNIFLGILLVYVLIISSVADAEKGLNIWPMPVSVSHGQGRFYLSNDLELRTDGRMYSDGSRILKDGFFRFLDIITGDHVIEANTSHFNSSLVIKGIHVVIISPYDKVNHLNFNFYLLYYVFIQLKRQEIKDTVHSIKLSLSWSNFSRNWLLQYWLVRNNISLFIFLNISANLVRDLVQISFLVTWLVIWLLLERRVRS